MSTTYSTPQVCEMAGVTYRQLDYWTRQGLVTPAVAGGKGSGSYRRWAPRQVATVAVLGQVASLGVLNRPGSQLANLAQFLEDLPLRYWPTTQILLDADGQVWRLSRPGAPLVGTFIDLAVAAGFIAWAATGRRTA